MRRAVAAETCVEKARLPTRSLSQIKRGGRVALACRLIQSFALMSSWPRKRPRNKATLSAAEVGAGGDTASPVGAPSSICNDRTLARASSCSRSPL